MPTQSSVAVRNASLDARVAAFGGAFRVQIRTGAPPANTAAAASGALLGEFAGMGSNAAANGQKVITGGGEITALATGTAQHYRVYDSGGTVCHEQGDIGLSTDAGPPAMIVDNPSIRAGQKISITGWTLTAAGA